MKRNHSAVVTMYEVEAMFRFMECGSYFMRPCQDKQKPWFANREGV